jgi:hypothetical protein
MELPVVHPSRGTAGTARGAGKELQVTDTVKSRLDIFVGSVLSLDQPDVTFDPIAPKLCHRHGNFLVTNGTRPAGLLACEVVTRGQALYDLCRVTRQIWKLGGQYVLVCDVCISRCLCGTSAQEGEKQKGES